MLKTVLIDDEPPARATLRQLLAVHPEVQVVGEAGLLPEARQLLARDDYDLVFLDVQLRGGTGFDLVPLVPERARVIFVTGFDTHAVRAFETNALDYLLKPLQPARLSESLRRVAALPPPVLEPMRPALPVLAPGDTAYVKTGPGAQLLRQHSVFRDHARCAQAAGRGLCEGTRAGETRPRVGRAPPVRDRGASLLAPAGGRSGRHRVSRAADRRKRPSPADHDEADRRDL